MFVLECIGNISYSPCMVVDFNEPRVRVITLTLTLGEGIFVFFGVVDFHEPRGRSTIHAQASPVVSTLRTHITACRPEEITTPTGASALADGARSVMRRGNAIARAAIGTNGFEAPSLSFEVGRERAGTL